MCFNLDADLKLYTLGPSPGRTVHGHLGVQKQYLPSGGYVLPGVMPVVL